MRRAIVVTALAAAAVDAAKSKPASTKKAESPSDTKSSSSDSAGTEFPSFSVAYTYTKDLLFLTKDLSIFVCTNAAKNVWGLVPEEHRSLVSTHFDKAYESADKVRKDQGMPDPANAVTEAKSQIYGLYEKGYNFVLGDDDKLFIWKGISIVESLYAGSPIGQRVEHMVSQFEKSYPQHKGFSLHKLAATPWDLLFGIAVLYLLCNIWLYVFGPLINCVWFLVCKVLCCGMCLRRKKAAEESKDSKVGKRKMK